jgi:hypothetical protein
MNNNYNLEVRVVSGEYLYKLGLLEILEILENQLFAPNFVTISGGKKNRESPVATSHIIITIFHHVNIRV